MGNRSKRWQRARARAKEEKLRGEIIPFPGSDKAPKAAPIKAAPIDKRVEEQSRLRLRELRAIITANAVLCAQGRLRGFIVFGDAGTGKTTAIMEALAASGPMIHDHLRWSHCPDDIPVRRLLVDDEGNRTYKPPYDRVTGHVSEQGLYELLYRHSKAGEGIVLDDVDVWKPPLLSMLLPVLETGQSTPSVSWLSSRRPADMPWRFAFDGFVIFITNKNLPALRGRGTMGGMIDALLSRVNPIDMRLAPHERPILARDLAAEALPKMGLSAAQIRDVMSFFETHLDDLSEVSARTVVNLANLRLVAEDSNIADYDWRRHAIITCCKKP